MNVMDKGSLFGKYEVGRLLGCGAFAKVYYGRNIRSGQSVAIKVINKKKMAGTTQMCNIKREIVIMRRLQHPNIVRLFEVLASKSKIYFVMEFVKGGELFAKVAKGRFSEELSRKYFQQLISAVRYCHSRGIYHRDLKPENLLIDENGDLKVSDFGLSALGDPDNGLSPLHTLCGTPAYVAPEILAKKGYDGARVDLWSCGVILYVLTAGYLPFNDPNLMAMYKKIYKGEFRCPKWMSSDLKRFLSRLLDTNPNTRITIDQITRDPWFLKGIDDIDVDEKEPPPPALEASCSLINAFDLISLSSGLDLSGLFDESFNALLDGERFLSSQPPDKIIHTIADVAAAHNVKLKQRKDKDCVLDLEGPQGNFIAKVEVNRLTQQLILVEVNKKGGDSASYNRIWKNKVRPQLSGLIHHPDTPPEPGLGVDTTTTLLAPSPESSSS